MKNWKKVLILGIVLLIIAGIIVVALKGFNVSLMFGRHDVIELNVGKEVNLDDIERVCSETLGNKRFILKEIKEFKDSFQLNVESITDDEKTALVSKINEKFETEKSVDDLTITTVANKRIRDSVRIYIVPVIIVYAIIYIYILIKDRKNNDKKIVLDNLWKTILSELILLSLIAITRIPVTDTLFFVLVAVAFAELTYSTRSRI